MRRKEIFIIYYGPEEAGEEEPVPIDAEEKMAVQANHMKVPAVIREPERFKCSLRQREFTDWIML